MRDEAVALGRQLDRVARVDLGELARRGEVGQEREAGLAGLLDEDADRGLAAVLRRDGLLAGGDEEHLEPVDVALGDAVGRVERERGLVVLARRAELAELPERLGQAVLRLGVGAELEQLAVRGRRLGPLRRPSPGRSPGRPAGASCAVRLTGLWACGLDVGEGHEAVVLSGRGGRPGAGRVGGRAVTRATARTCFVAPSAGRVKRRRVRRPGGSPRQPRSSRFQATTTTPSTTSSDDLPDPARGRGGATASRRGTRPTGRRRGSAAPARSSRGIAIARRAAAPIAIAAA